MNIVLLGGPGAGKGTQAEFMIEKFGLLHISTGDLLREAVANKTESGLKAKAYMDAGDLVPDDVILGIMREKFQTQDISRGLILDGFPRTLPQAEALDKMIEELNTKINMAICIDTPKDVIIERICSRRMCKDCGHIGSVMKMSDEEKANYVCPECGGQMYQRDDDNEQTVLNRIEVYNKNTAPLIDYYKKQNKLQTVNGAVGSNGQASAEAVFLDIEKLIK